MATETGSERVTPDDESAEEVLRFLRGRVRNFGFAEADLALQEKLVDLGGPVGRLALKEYFEGLSGYLQIFSEVNMQLTGERISNRVGEFAWWRLARGGDKDRFKYSADPQEVLVDDMREYVRIERVLVELRELMKDFGFMDGPDNDGTPLNPIRRVR